MRWMRRGVLVLLSMVAAAIAVAVVEAGDWRTASRESAGIAPDPATTPEAVVQAYAARAFSWRGVFGVHTWIAAKPTGAPRFTVYEVIGWRLRMGLPVVAVHQRPADARWFDALPEIIADIRGEGVDDVIRRLDEAARSYPFADQYRAWPGPNSNTFVAHLARAAPELRLDLPPTAVGKDYLDGVVARAPSGTGYQVSLFGLAGLLAGAEEGVEIDLLGLTFGVDPLGPALKLPLVGRIGAK